MKRLNARASLQALTDLQILTDKAIFQWSSKNNPGIKFFFVSNKDVNKNHSNLVSTSGGSPRASFQGPGLHTAAFQHQKHPWK